jgi:hypothetical protein
MPGAFDCNDQLPLMFGACSCDALGNDFSLLVYTSLKAFLILIINVNVFAVTESACPLLPLLLLFPLWPARPVGIC